MKEVYTFKKVSSLPTMPGVYTFYGSNGEPLYIGKSKNIRGRVLSHLSEYRRSGKRKRLYSAIDSIGVELMAGDLGASLMELIRIKEELPLYNRRSRYAQELVYVLESINTQGCKVTSLERKPVSIGSTHNLLGVFRSERIAKSILFECARNYLLCPKLLGLEKGKGGCFSLHLDGCKGACVGKESNKAYNLRFDCAFGHDRVREWAYSDTITITETSSDGVFKDIWTIKDWTLTSAYRCSGNICVSTFISKPKTFDIDMYHVLQRFI